MSTILRKKAFSVRVQSLPLQKDFFSQYIIIRRPHSPGTKHTTFDAQWRDMLHNTILILTLLLNVVVRLSTSLQLCRVARRCLSSAFFIVTCATADPCHAQDFDFPNGRVQIDEPLIFTLKERSLRLNHPVLVGYGGGGSVYSFDTERDLLVKISWTDSAKSVKRECDTLQYLQSKQVTATERCLGVQPYPYDTQRVMIAVTPYVRDAVASIGELANPDLQAKAVQQVAQTLVQMLIHNIVTIDVQPLISQTTGEVIFIDMTEALILHPPFSFLDQALVGSFCSEMIALIPEKWANVAAQTIKSEMEHWSTQSMEMSDETREILLGQTFLFP